MVDRTASEPQAWGAGNTSREAVLRRRYPTIEDLRRRARRRAPKFAFDFVDAGAGSDIGIARNRSALEAIELTPRYCIDVEPIATEVTLFGRTYAAPIGIAPMGIPALMWPGADEHLARAAQDARVPHVLASVASATIERIAKLAPDVWWFQLYRLPSNEHAVAFDLMRRAEAAGAHALVLTVDGPVRPKRPRDLRNGLVLPFRPTPRTLFEIATSPAWLMALIAHGVPRFENFARYCGERPSSGAIAAFAQREVKGSHTFEEIARIRERWSAPIVLKGVMHPADAEKAVALGVDGILVSNHGGRQLDGIAAAIDVLPAIVAAVGSRATVLMDSGIRSGLDVVRALALGARAVFVGRPFLYGIAALGADGASHVVDFFIEEVKSALGQLGARSVAEATRIALRHPNAWRFD